MKISFRRSHFAVALMGTFAAPFLISTAQAKPPSHAPAYGFRKDKNPDRDERDYRGDRDNRDDDDEGDERETRGDRNTRNERDNFSGLNNVNGLSGRDTRGNRNITVVGIVTRDLSGSDRFTVRLENGRRVEVISRDREPIRLSRGDRVQLRGDFEGTLFIADRVRILNNVGGNGGNANQATTLSGRVTRDFSGRDFELRRDNGTTTRVRSLRAEPIRLTNGDRVTVRGHFEGTLFMARSVDIRRNDDRQNVNFPATVLRRVLSGRLLVRGDNGRNYTVISNASLARFDRDDRVRVRGFINGGLVSADSVVLLKNR